MKIIVESDPATLLAQIRVVIRGGSLLDPVSRPGLANLTARMLLRGTRKRGYQELTREIEALGATVAVRVDVSHTWVTAAVLQKNLEPFLELLGEVLAEPSFPESETVLLKSMIQGELRSELQEVRWLATRAALKLLYPGTGLSIPAEGTVKGIEALGRDDVLAFYGSHYVADAAVAAISSPRPAARAEALLAQALSGLPEGSRKFAPLPELSASGFRGMIAEREEMSTVPFYFATPGISDRDPDAWLLELGNFVFGADFTSRLMQELRGKNGWTYGASSDFHMLIGPKPEPTVFSLYSFPSAEHASKAIPRALELLLEYVDKGVTEEEFAQAREALMNKYPFRVDTAAKRLDRRLREELTGRRALSVDEYRSMASSWDAGQVNRVIRARMRTRPLAVAAAGDPALLRPILSGLPGIDSVESTVVVA